MIRQSQRKVRDRYSLLVLKFNRQSITDKVVSSLVTATIKDLPNELLEDIFETYVNSGCSPCWLLMVCKRWRAVALANTKLWTCIRIRDVDFSRGNSPARKELKWKFKGSGEVITEGQWQICKNQSMLNRALERSGSYASIKLSASDTFGGHFIGNLKRGLTLTPSIYARIEVLQLGDIGPGMEAIMEMMSTTKLQRLKELSLSSREGEWVSQFLNNINTGSRLLTKLQLDAKVDESVSKLRLWSKICTLEMSLSLISPAVATAIMTRCTGLVEFHSMGDGWPEYELNLPPEVFSKVSKASFKCETNDLSRHNFPSLETLKIEHRAHLHSRTAFRQINFPLLTNLEIDSKDSTGYPKHWNVPRLITFRFRCSAPPPTSFPSALNISVEHTTGSLSLGSLFNLVPDAQRLSYVHARYERQYAAYWNLADRNVDGLMRLGDTGTCPNLEILTLGDQNRPICLRPHVNMSALVKRILEARRKKGMSMIYFEMHQYNDTSHRVELCQYGL